MGRRILTLFVQIWPGHGGEKIKIGSAIVHCVMGPSDDLFELIKKLDQGERQRLRRLAMLARDDGSPPHYLKLFDDLLKLKQYDEKAFREAHREEGYEASFPQNKIYLYNLILDALRGQRKYVKSEKPKDFQIRERIEEAHLLKQKMLFDQSLKQLEKAKKEAERHQYLELLLEILRLLRTYTNEHPDKDYIRNFRDILAQIDWVGEQIRINCRLLRLRDELFLVARSGAPDPAIMDVHAQVLAMEDALKRDAPWPRSVEAQTNYHLAIALHYQLGGNIQAAWNHHREVYVLWRAEHDFREVRRTQYIKILHNYLTISIAARKQVDFIEALEFLEKGSFTSPDERAESKQNAMYVRLQYFLTYREWDNALRVEDEFRLKKEWVTEKMQRPRLLSFYIGFARLHLILDNGQKAKHYLSYFEEEHLEGIHDDKLAEAKVLQVLLRYGAIQDVDLEARIRAARRYVAKKEKAPAYFGVFLGALDGVVKVSADARREAWGQMLDKLKASVRQLPYDGGYYLLQSWIIAQRDAMRLQDV